MKKFKIKKILVPTDFSETAAIALGQAVNLAKLCSAKIKLIHIVTPVYVTGNEALLPYGDTFYNRLLKASKKKMTVIANEIMESEQIEVGVDSKIGIIEKVIDDVATKEKFDLIMMGTHGTSGVREFFIGSNAFRVVHNEQCPVITIQKKATKKGFKNIILPIRLELTSRQKVDTVVELAKVFNSTVHITGYTDSDRKYDQNRVKRYVEQVEEYLDLLGIKHTSTSIFSDNFTKDIIAHAKKKKADLVAITINHDRSLNQLVKGPFAQQFVNHSPIPVLSVPVTEPYTDLVFTPYLSGVSPV